MSDIHIGAFRQPELRSLVLSAFEAAIDSCMKENVDFTIMAGDIFDSNIPDLGAVRQAATKIREASDAGMRFYAIYGSHDFSPNYSSIVDVLDGAGLFASVEVRNGGTDRVSLRFIEDPTGAKLCGISGKKLSLDMEDYRRLDRRPLEEETGFKVFVFHGGLDELKPSSLEMMETMPASLLPGGFSYYAGGHIHTHVTKSLPGRPNITYPGPLFATNYTELVDIARGDQRGFYLVDFDDHQVTEARFVPVRVCDVMELHFVAEGKTPLQVTRELLERVERTDVTGKVVLITVEGKLRDGRTSDVNFPAVRKRLQASNPLIVLLNYSSLTSTDLMTPQGPSRSTRFVERELFERNISGVRTEVPKLRGTEGVTVALDLLRTLKESKKENESRAEFEERIAKAGLGVLGLKEET
jgi:DNA repair exonuclease SbcCD nuclease subunit